MNKKLSLSAIIMLLVLAVFAVPVWAAPPQDVHIVVNEQINVDLDGEFSISGSAAEAGIVCPSGKTLDLDIQVSGPPDGEFRNLRVIKRFECGDGSGTFDLQLIVRLDLNTNETTARWNVIEGTGAYSDLEGRGSLVGTPAIHGQSITDVYEGTMN